MHNFGFYWSGGSWFTKDSEAHLKFHMWLIKFSIYFSICHNWNSNLTPELFVDNDPPDHRNK